MRGEAADSLDQSAASRPPSSALRLRILSALVMAPLALAAVWFGSPYFPALVALLAIGMGREWARLAGGNTPPVSALVIATPLAAIAAIFFGASVLAILLVLLGATLVGVVARLTRAAAPLWLAGGTAWLALPCVAILWVAAADGRNAILWLLALVWASDIGAYAAGRSFGGPRLAPLLSPNKTWAGAMGGAGCAALVGGGAALLFDGPIAISMGMSLVLSVAAQVGDLMESLAKRKFGAKDSGALIPGHGGLLDRLDSLLTAAAVLGLLTLFGAAAPFVTHP